MPLLPANSYRKIRGIIRRETRANQPSAATVLEGTLFFVVDEGVFERSNGAAWVSCAITVANDSITNAKLRDSAGVSVIGRSANSVGDPADIVAAANNRFLKRIANALSFDQVDLASGDITGILPVANGGSGLTFNPRVALEDSNATQTIPTATWTKVTFDVEIWDNDSMHSLSVNTSRITFNTTGMYLLNGAVGWDTNTVGDRGIRILKNNIAVCIGGVDIRAASALIYQPVSAQNLFLATDFADLEVYQNSGTNRTIIRDSNVLPRFGAVRIGG